MLMRSEREVMGLSRTLDGNGSRWCAQASYRDALRTFGVTNPVEIGIGAISIGRESDSRKEKMMRLTCGVHLSASLGTGPACHPKE